MANAEFSIRVTGLKELNRALKAVGDKVAADGLKSAFLMIAGVVASRARGKIGHQISGDAAGSIQPHASSRGATISFGGQKAPYMPWLDFGGTTGRHHQDGPWKGVIKRTWLGKPGGMGRYVYPAISESSAEILQAVDEAMGKIAKEEGF